MCHNGPCTLHNYPLSVQRAKIVFDTLSPVTTDICVNTTELRFKCWAPGYATRQTPTRQHPLTDPPPPIADPVKPHVIKEVTFSLEERRAQQNTTYVETGIRYVYIWVQCLCNWRAKQPPL